MEVDFFKCSKCGGRMTKGYMVDSDRIGSSISSFDYSHWIEGEPEYSEGLFGQTKNLNVDNKKKYVIRASRCTKCGYLDLYAV